MQQQVSDTKQHMASLQEERDAEKKARVSFEMRLVEFEDYKKHAETDIVSVSYVVKSRCWMCLLVMNLIWSFIFLSGY